jgi:hypothetical protein
MTTRFQIIFILIIAFASCTAKKNVVKPDVSIIDTNLYNLKDYQKFENSINSEDKSYNHFVSISKEIYPYFNSRKLKHESKRFIRKDKSKFISEANYYYDKNNNVKLIFYEWNYNGSNDNFKKEFDSITNFLNSKIGKYDYKKIEEDNSDETNRDDIKWTNGNVKAYLFRFKNKYNQIRLAIYKK